MKRVFLTLSMIMAMGIAAWAQSPVEVEITDNEDSVQLEMISPAQPVQESAREVKEREKRLREFNDDVAYAKASNSIRRGYFVFVADYIQVGHAGYRHYDINPNSNFILVQDDDGIIQFAFNTGNPGLNGLGGWTGKGKVRNKHVKFKDDGEVFVQYRLVGSNVDTSVHITLSPSSNQAVARVGDMTFYGKILPYRDSDHR